MAGRDAGGVRADPSKLLVLLFMAAVIVPNLIAVALPAESWPYTNAPMFAHRVAPDTPRYAFVFTGQTRNGEEVELGYYSAGARWSLWRMFFKFVYGSAPQGGVFSVHPSDDRAQLEQRLSRFFTALVDRYHDRPGVQPLGALALGVAPLTGIENRRGAIRRLGIYDVSTRRYSHQWESGS